MAVASGSAEKKTNFAVFFLISLSLESINPLVCVSWRAERSRRWGKPWVVFLETSTRDARGSFLTQSIYGWAQAFHGLAVRHHNHQTRHLFFSHSSAVFISELQLAPHSPRSHFYSPNTRRKSGRYQSRDIPVSRAGTPVKRARETNKPSTRTQMWLHNDMHSGTQTQPNRALSRATICRLQKPRGSCSELRTCATVGWQQKEGKTEQHGRCLGCFWVGSCTSSSREDRHVHSWQAV